MNRAASRTSRVIGASPTNGAANGAGPIGTLPLLGISEKIPLIAPGNRIEPPPSVPSETGPTPSATEVADPPLDPPDDRSRSHALRASGTSRFTEARYPENSGMFVFPNMTAPASRRRRTGVASSVGT